MAEVARLDVVGADRVKSDFISSLSHELRSPLMLLSTFAKKGHYDFDTAENGFEALQAFQGA
ncbi:hypothetical protein C8A00DRAFT_33171 [Chaetomidium leptoderma]|uniref:Signal transduction histidine kinase dimerisation/phosphoacceptor domain-containing protein n=1 Tax=Chaetomidium leptoderma TaxID=669021 RepID=A0AAN6VM11_9PEZI|nr:hypothetical protein C8A00DRAFT_33171 [Chaetomidium leptoderma]